MSSYDTSRNYPGIMTNKQDKRRKSTSYAAENSDSIADLWGFLENIRHAPEWRIISTVEFVQRAEALWLHNRDAGRKKHANLNSINSELEHLCMLLIAFINNSYSAEFKQPRQDRIKMKSKLTENETLKPNELN